MFIVSQKKSVTRYSDGIRVKAFLSKHLHIYFVHNKSTENNIKSLIKI